MHRITWPATMTPHQMISKEANGYHGGEQDQSFWKVSDVCLGQSPSVLFWS